MLRLRGSRYVLGCDDGYSLITREVPTVKSQDVRNAVCVHRTNDSRIVCLYAHNGMGND